MYSVLLLTASILAASPNVSPTGHKQSYGDTEFDMIPAFICGMVVNVDKKTFEEIQDHDQHQADSCKVKRLDPDDSLLDEPKNTSDIA